MKVKNIFLSSAILLALCSCSNANQNLGFDTPELVQADSIAINEILSPKEWLVVNQQAVAYSLGSENVFYVYSLPEFKFLYSHGKIGGGPGEFSKFMRLPNSNSCGTNMYVDDYGKNQITKYSVDKTKITNVGSMSNRAVKESFFSNHILSPEHLLTTKIDLNSLQEYLHLRSAKDGISLDSVLMNSFSEIETDGDGDVIRKSTVNAPLIHVGDNKVAVLYQLTPNVEIYNVTKDNKFKLIASLGEKMDATANSELKSIIKSLKQKVILNTLSTDKYIYAIQVEIERDTETKRPNIISSEILIYDWEGNQIKRLLLSKPASEFIVAPDDSKIYAYSQTEDLEKVYVYDPKL